MPSFVNWTAPDLESDKRWVFRLSDRAIAEIVEQARRSSHLADDLLRIDRKTFHLSPETVKEFTTALEMTQHAYGVSLIKGFPARDLSEAEFRVATWGTGLYMGLARPQNVAGDFLTDVRDAGSSAYRVVNGRGYNTSSELDFHIDSADAVLLYCRREARSGGESLITNPFSVAQHLIKQNPDHAPMLTQLYPFSLGGYKVDGKEHYLLPLMEQQGDACAFRINIKNIKNGAIQAGMTLSSEEMEFLYKFQDLAGSDRFCYRMYLQEGDIQILNNFHIIHSRTAFEDFDEPDRKRHLIRLWLCLQQSQPLPESWHTSFGSIEPGSVRGGFRNIALDARYEAHMREQCEALGIRL
ncbi:TauD/TfdA family dioxygenase [Orrella marina]|uniref:TauD/TfdA-like domain-containing protein n=1 Tax=Orrella marina TaxID=2163011 RepID=A0A2R4XHG1_9BURK|nr:TauD/TfdA family dioxygenase [Orrella marina]AWB33173.1 hypothetical protein DBV39_04995 [Orrella marina]